MSRRDEPERVPAEPARRAAAEEADCDEHTFKFDLDRAISEQLVESLEKSHRHPLGEPRAPRAQGVYAIYREGEDRPIYIGKTGVAAIKKAKNPTDIRSRVRQHVRTLAEAPALKDAKFEVRYLVIPESWRIVQAETALITKYHPVPLNGTGFGNHTPGVGRPGKEGVQKNAWIRFVEGEIAWNDLIEIARRSGPEPDAAE